MTPYETVFNSFLKRIEDENLPKFTEEEQTSILIGYLDEAISMMEADDLQLTHDLSKRDDTTLSFEEDLDKIEIELLAKVMVVAWYEPKINSIETTVMMIGVSGEKWTTQKDLAESLRERRKKAYTEVKKLVRAYHYRHNEYLGGDNNG